MSASEVQVRDIPPRIRSLPTVSRDVLCMPGLTQWGPVNKAQIVIDFDDYVTKYRGFQATAETAVQVRQFFLGGGRKAILNRVVHIDGSGNPVSAAKATRTLSTGATAATAGTVLGTNVGPFALANGDTLIGSVDGNPNDTATFTATAATITSGNAENYALADGQTLTVRINGGAVQTITFNTAEFVSIGAATAEEVAAVINAEITGASADAPAGTNVRITSDRLGTSSGVEVTGGTANTALGFSTTPVTGTGNVANIASVTLAEIKTIVEAAWVGGSGVTVTDISGQVQIATNVAGATGSILVVAASTADDELGLDNATHPGFDGTVQNTLRVDGLYPGELGNSLAVTIAPASGGEASKFDLVVFLSGAQEETFSNVTMDSTDQNNYVVNRINTLAGKSVLVSVADLAAVGTPTQRKPAAVTAVALVGGNDGLAALDDNDFIGTEANTTGIFAFELQDEGDLLAVPDRPTAAVANAAINYCETQRKLSMVFVPDIPAGLDKDGVVAFTQSLTSSEQAVGVAWPRIKIPNPSKAVYGPEDTIIIATSGSQCGRFARNTLSFRQDVFTQPGNEIFGRLENVTGVETEEVNKISVQRFVTPFRINPIRAGRTTDGGFAVWLNDVQALKGDGNFKSIGEIRGVSLIRKVVAKYLETIRTTPNTPENRARDQFVIEAYLAQWLAKGVFASKKASDAFFVNTDPQGIGINNPVEQEAERYTVVIGLATARARRFILLQFTRDQRAVEAFIQQQLTAP